MKEERQGGIARGEKEEAGKTESNKAERRQIADPGGAASPVSPSVPHQPRIFLPVAGHFDCSCFVVFCAGPLHLGRGLICFHA